MDRPRFEVADVFRCYGADYRLQNGASMSNAQHRVMTAIEVCRTAVLGGHLEQCDQCGHQRNAFNSCRNRHCPKCQSLARAQWLQDRQAELLNTEYFHLVDRSTVRFNDLKLLSDTPGTGKPLRNACTPQSGNEFYD